MDEMMTDLKLLVALETKDLSTISMSCIHILFDCNPSGTLPAWQVAFDYNGLKPSHEKGQ
jgi:hypothetical protein